MAPFRRRPSSIFWSLAILACTSSCSEADPALTTRAKTVVGHELRLIVETSCTVSSAFSHHSDTKDVKGYLVVVDIASKQAMVERSRVYGPLWDVAQPRSQLSFSAGPQFTKADVDAALATPHCDFDENGDLIRYRHDLTHNKLLFDRLDLPKRIYKDAVAYGPIDNQTPPMSEEQVVSPSGRYMLLYQKGAAHLYDLYTGHEKADPWLTDRFAESRRIPGFSNVRAIFTDDLDHMIVSPHTLWNEGNGAPIHETFEFAGKTLSRSEYFLCADRPERTLGIVQRKDDEKAFLQEAPTAAITINRELMLMFATKNAIRLYRRDGSVVYHSEANVAAGWANGSFGTRHLPSDGKLVFFTVDLANMEQVMDRHVAMNIWDYRHNTVTTEVVSIIDLFRETASHYILRGDPIVVKEP